MAELTLEKEQRLALKAEAHSLDPVVLLGAAGVTEAVIAEIDRALTAHSLIKVRVPIDDRLERESIFAAIADRVGAARVQAIGKLVVLYRPTPPEDEEEQARARGDKRLVRRPKAEARKRRNQR